MGEQAPLLSLKVASVFKVILHKKIGVNFSLASIEGVALIQSEEVREADLKFTNVSGCVN